MKKLALFDLDNTLLHGDSDRVVPPRVGQALAAEIPGAELTLLERTGHNPQNERPEATARAILAMLDRVDGGTRSAAARP